ncbi:MAG: hypothetical protein GY838_12225 [bacterium]|nr:hypothetical protein [bacterium]
MSEPTLLISGGRIAAAATDHAHYTLEEKERSYLGAPSGLPLVQFLFPALRKLHAEGVLTLPQLVTKACHNAAGRPSRVRPCRSPWP